MHNKKFSIFSIIFLLLFAASFVYLFSTQQLFPDSNPVIRRNTNQIIPGSPDASLPSDQVLKFSSYDEFSSFIASYSSGDGDLARNMAMPIDMPRAGMMVDVAEDFAGIAEETTSVPATGLGSGGSSFSQTNIQVEGVDEADVVKTDGEYLYIVSGSSVYIVDADPQNAAIVSTLEFDGYPQELYLNDGHLIVYGREFNEYEIGVEEGEKPLTIAPFREVDSVFLQVFDLATIESPDIIRDLSFEGYVSRSRMIGDYVYLVTSKGSYYYPGPVPLPRIVENDEVIFGDPEQPDFIMPDVYYFNIPYQNPQMTSITSVNVSDVSEPVNSDVYMMEYTQNIYVSQENIYLTYTKYLDQQQVIFEVTKEYLVPQLPAAEQDKIRQIESVPDFILSKYEKLNKVVQTIEQYVSALPKGQRDSLEKNLTERISQRMKELHDQLEQTIIHKVAVKNGSMAYQSMGSVLGHVLNQFSMDEHDGYFRIATTKNPSWSQFIDTDDDNQPYSNVFILNKDLVEVGAVERLAPGEQIFSVRFMQGRAYMVTFERVDPLFVIDVSNPENPSVLGELKIPGFSNYLHPYDETTLIGLGQDTEENEWGGITTRGIKVSLFDVSDVSSPREITNYIIDAQSASSYALSDHRAFLFSRDRELLAFPVSIWASSDLSPIEIQGKSFVGAAVFNITGSSIDLRGFISHEGVEVPQGQSITVPREYIPPVKRVLYIDDALYTVSDGRVKLNNLDDLAELGDVSLPFEGPRYEIYEDAAVGRPVPAVEF